jgi:hypothetical protein
MIEHTNGKSPGPINIYDQSRVNVRLCHDVCQPQQTLAASAQIILFLEMLKFPKNVFIKEQFFVKVK